jgi:hypothetical protein
VTAPLVPSPLYGLRTWAVTGGERLSGPQQDAAWPLGGAWLEAACASDPGHAAPEPRCACGVHALHPSRRAARRLLAARREIPGVVEAAGAIEVHEEGFRAARARPAAFFVVPGRNAALVRRLAAAHAVAAVEVRDADALLAWCRERGYGLAPDVVAALLGPEVIERWHAAARRRARANALRLGAVVAVMAALVAGGLAFTANPGDRELFGRTGPVHQR